MDPFTTFADNHRQGELYDDPDSRILIACDRSLDEDAVVRATFTPSLGSSGVEYFVGLSGWEACVVRALIQGDTDLAVATEDLASVVERLSRVVDYTAAAIEIS